MDLLLTLILGTISFVSLILIGYFVKGFALPSMRLEATLGRIYRMLKEEAGKENQMNGFSIMQKTSQPDALRVGRHAQDTIPIRRCVQWNHYHKRLTKRGDGISGMRTEDSI